MPTSTTTIHHQSLLNPAHHTGEKLIILTIAVVRPSDYRTIVTFAANHYQQLPHPPLWKKQENYISNEENLKSVQMGLSSDVSIEMCNSRSQIIVLNILL